jgi:hypothetical protein
MRSRGEYLSIPQDQGVLKSHIDDISVYKAKTNIQEYDVKVVSNFHHASYCRNS